MTLPRTRYAMSGDVSIAYQVMGDGPLDLVIIPGGISNVEFQHELPGYTRFLERLATFARVITFDKRGNGMSDRATEVASLEVRMDDARAVMDAAGSERAAIMGVSEGGPLSILFAATYPERTRALIVYGSFATAVARDDWPAGIDPMITNTLDTASLSATWGQDGAALPLFAPSVGSIPEWRALWAKLERNSATPGAVVAVMKANLEMDVRPVLPTIRVPSLVLHKRGDRVCPLDAGRRIAAAIPGARFVELDGDDHFYTIGDPEETIQQIGAFLTGQRQEPMTSERVLATVLLTDIVASTERATELGDRRWRELLDTHDELVARQLTRFRGRLVKNTGDGIVATFDGPGRAISCATAIRDGVQAFDLQTTSGLHTGEIELRGDDIGGIAVHIAARVQAAAAAGEVLVSRTVADLVAGSGIHLTDRGAHQLKGVDGDWQLFSADAGA